MKTVGANEARTHFSRLLDEVAAGETITITRHGVPLVMLVPVKERRVDVGAAIDVLRELQREVGGMDSRAIRAMIEEGRRS